MKTKYFLYARKSTEDEERQVMSIEAQIAELAEYAKREGIEITETFIESKSAKKPGREIFNKMMSKVYESREPVGLIAWHPDRLARNSVDGGQIIYCVDINKIISLRFPTFWFEPTPQGLFMLQVAFGQSKYYSDNLSENVKRGKRQKLRRGEYPGKAPLGYVNNPKTRNVDLDPTKSRLIKKAFEEYATGKYTLESLGIRLSFWGIVSRTGTPLYRASIYRMLTNKSYLGLITQKGETYQGNFEPIVSLSDFEAVQKILKQKGRPRKSKIHHAFPFTGLLRCKECGSMISAQWAKGKYRYYRCTKKHGNCSQGYLSEEALAYQIKARLQSIALCDDWADEYLAQCDVWEKEEVKSSQSFAQNIETKIKENENKMDKLVNAFLDGTIERENYLVKKDELMKSKLEFNEKKDGFDRAGNNWIELLREWIKSANNAKKLASSNDFEEIKSFAKKIGTNHQMYNKNVIWNYLPEYQIIAEISGNTCDSAQATAESQNSAASKNLVKSGMWDLNPRPLGPKPSALARLR